MSKKVKQDVVNDFEQFDQELQASFSEALNEIRRDNINQKRLLDDLIKSLLVATQGMQSLNDTLNDARQQFTNKSLALDQSLLNSSF